MIILSFLQTQESRVPVFGLETNTRIHTPLPQETYVIPRAQKYVCRDIHEVFFRPDAKGKRKRDPW